MAITPILFMGPVRAGKSTIANLVAAQLSLLHISLDELRWKYYSEIGYDDDLAKHIIYTKDKTPEQSCLEVLELIK